jgi:hypothetical protein
MFVLLNLGNHATLFKLVVSLTLDSLIFPVQKKKIHLFFLNSDEVVMA